MGYEDIKLILMLYRMINGLATDEKLKLSKYRVYSIENSFIVCTTFSLEISVV